MDCRAEKLEKILVGDEKRFILPYFKDKYPDVVLTNE